MAFNATTVWECRTTGNSANGGAFDPGVASPGTDRSNQDAAQVAFTDLVIDGAVNTSVTSAANPFGATSPGNFINITGGAGFTVQRVEILSVSGSTATVDKSLGTLGSTGGTGNLGGGMTDPGVISGLMVGGNTLFIKAGTYTINSTSSNVANGRLAPPAGTTANPTIIIGYNTNRNAGNSDTKPLLQGSVVSALTLITVPASGNFYIDNLALDGGALTTSKGIDSTAASTGTLIFNCKFSNFTSNGQIGGTSSLCILCEGTSNSGTSFNGSHYWFCTAHNNTTLGFNNGGNAISIGYCVASNNTGASTDGFTLSTPAGTVINCTAYTNGRDGFRFTAGAAQVTCVGCIAEGNVGFGYRASAAFGNVRLIQCGGKADGSGLVDTATITATQIGTITATAEIFVNVAGNDFRLNNDPNGGTKFKAAGLPGSSALLTLPGLASAGTSFGDAGALQHQDAIPPGVLFQAGSVIAGS
jgi:hypothetical protein